MKSREWGNGIILCDIHHRFAHKMHWRIEGSVYGALRFIAPNGRVFTGMPPPTTDFIRRKTKVLLECAG